ncbi:MAG: hypothetical protein KDE59_29700, partial [Anaerolineales bacterium]|nr:hypothetical protein [Anaerolineales bacterium]
FAAALTEVDALWAFLPANINPQVPQAALTLAMAYDAAADKFSGSGSIALKMGLPDLPDLPGLSLLQITTGDEDGLIDLTVSGGFTDDNGAITPYMNATIDNALTVDVNFPGLSQPTPPIHTSLKQIAFDLSTDANGDFAGGLVLTGDFSLRPLLPSQMGLPVPPAIAVQLEQLLGSVGLLPLAGTTEQAIRFRGDQAAFSMNCTFSEAALEVDLFDMFASLAGGLAGPAGLDNTTNAIDLDIEVRFELKQIDLQLGSLEPDQPQFSLSITFGLAFGGASTDLVLALSDEQFTFGFSELPIPIALPQMPLKLDDLLALEGADGRWDYAGLWLTQQEPALTSAISSKNGALSALRSQIQALEHNLIDIVDQAALRAGRAELRQLRDRDMPALQKEIFHLTGKRFLIDAIFAVHNILATPANQAAFQAMVKAYQGIMDQTIGRIYLDTELSFVIYDARFVLPFNDPSDIRVEGGARLAGFADDDPLRLLGELGFKLGLSADAIYFSVEGGGEIPLPAVGRYEGGAINLQRLNLGYGYNKNSFMIDFAGELRIPPALVDDLDTSDLIGAGIRLPVQNALAFKLDLIPVSFGEVNFVVPLLEFDIDLRQPATPGLLDANRCTPAWDGLQLILPELLRIAIKRYRFNPFFGPLPAPNITYSYDIQLGNESRGFTLICDNYLQINGILGAYPIPLFADAVTPFFDNLCVNLNFAGFRIKFNLQRPFPSMSPLAIFELLGLLSDPTMPVDPEGQLANMARATIQNAIVSLPPAVVRLFPELGPYLDRELNYTLNLSSIITLVQQLTGWLSQVADATVTAAGDMAALVAELQAHPPELDLTTLLRELPPELRRYQLNGSFVGFHASAWLFLLTPAEAQREYARLTDPGAAADSALLYEANFQQDDLSAWEQVNQGVPLQPGQWVNQGAYVQQTSNTGHNDLPQYGPLLVYRGQRFAEADFTVSLASLDDDGIGVVFRYQDPQNYYRFRLTQQQERWSLVRLRDGHAEELFSRPGRYQRGRPYQVTVRCHNQRASGPIPQQLVAIEILVDGRRWCQIVDSRSHLLSGHIGFSCWWNKDARFYSLRVYGEPAGQLAIGQPTAATAVANWQPNLGDKPLFQPDDPANNLLAGAPLMSEFDDADFAALANLAESDSLAILTGAAVQLLPGQRFAFLGFLDEEGHFSLLSRADLEPLTLTVAGIAVPLPVQFSGRLLLRGRAAGADSWAQVSAQTWGSWPILPLNLVRLELASAAEPASFTLYSDGRFALQGNGRLLFFDEQVVMSGAVRIDHTHCFVKGSVSYEYRPVADEPPLISLTLASRGRIGPERTFSLGGGGDLMLLGQPLSAVSGELTERALALSGRLQVGGKNEWLLAGLNLTGVDLTLQGQLQFATAKSGPRLAMAGRGQLTALGATVGGAVELAIGPGERLLALEGALQWQGRDWLAGRIELHNERLTISGRTTFALDLTPADLFSDINLASLYFTIDLSGSFELTAADGLKRVNLKVDWTLAARFPGQQKQILPLASQQKEVNKYNVGASGTLRELLYIASVNFLPFGDFTIPVPVIDMEEGVDVYLSYDGFIPQLTLEAPPPPPDDPDPFFSLPGLGTDEIPLEAIMNNFNLFVRLAWENGQLGIRLVRGGETEFIPFHAMFN